MIEDFMKVLNVSGEPWLLIETQYATLWRIKHAPQDLVIKHFKPGVFKDDAPGLRYCAAKEETGCAAKILGLAEDLCVMEYLDGPTLGDLARAGNLLDGDRRLARIASDLMAAPCPPLDFPHVSSWYQDLYDLKFAPECPPELARDMRRARDLTKPMLSAANDLVVLHGDLHHDNVIITPNGAKAIDAKGVHAPRAFEASNALRNPVGLEDEIKEIDLLQRRIDLYADIIDCPASEIAGWAASRAALSIAWRAQGTLRTDPDSDILSGLMYIVDGKK